MKDSFPTILAEELKRRGLSQAQVAMWAGVPASSISHFIAGSRKPSFETLIKLADALRVSTDFLLGRKTNE